jgi:hypothetical protein
MRRNRLYCECGARKSKVEEIHGKPVATCKACGASIPLYKDEYAKYHPKRVEGRAI